MSSGRLIHYAGATIRTSLVHLQLYDLKVQVERDLHHHKHRNQGSPADTRGAQSGENATCELILLDSLISVSKQNAFLLHLYMRCM